MIDIAALESEIRESGLTKDEIAKRIGISTKTLRDKLREGVFKTNEVDTLIDILRIDDPMKVFFVGKKEMIRDRNTPLSMKVWTYKSVMSLQRTLVEGMLEKRKQIKESVPDAAEKDPFDKSAEEFLEMLSQEEAGAFLPVLNEENEQGD